MFPVWGGFAGHMCRLGDMYSLAKLSLQRVHEEVAMGGSAIATWTCQRVDG